MAATARKTRNPVVESQIEKLDQDVEEQKQIAARLQGEIDFHVSKMERIPIFEQKTAAITRDYDTLKARYASMLDKKLMADTASAMERRQKAERFVILDPAQVPEKPYSPNRPLFLLAGLIGGLFAGIATALLKEVTDESIRDRFEAERILGKPVLSLVPEMLSVGQQWRRRMALCVMSITTITVSVVLGLGLAHFSRRFF